MFVSIDPSKVKVRWEEPYSSESINSKMSSFPSGVYRGANVNHTTVPSQSVLIGHNVKSMMSVFGFEFPDTFLICHVIDSGFSIALKDTDFVTMDLSEFFTGPGGTIPANITVHFRVEFSYSVGIATAAKYVASSIPAAGGVPYVNLFDYTLLSGISTITIPADFWPINESTQDKPVPSWDLTTEYSEFDKIYGFVTGKQSWCIPSVNEKQAMVNADNPSETNPFITKSQSIDLVLSEPTVVKVTYVLYGTLPSLPGLYYVGKGSFSGGTREPAKAYFSPRKLSSTSGLLDPMMGSANHQIIAGNVYNSSGVLLSDGDIDANGFVLNPKISLNVAYNDSPLPGFSGDVYFLCFKKKTIQNLTQETAMAFPLSGFISNGHAETTRASDKTSSTGTLVGHVDFQLKTMWDEIALRAKISIGITDSPVLINTYDASTYGSNDARNRVNIYSYADNVYTISGGEFVNDSGWKVKALNSGGNIVTFQIVGRSGVIVGSGMVATGEMFSVSNGDNWTSYQIISNGSTYGYSNFLNMIAHGSVSDVPKRAGTELYPYDKYFPRSVPAGVTDDEYKWTHLRSLLGNDINGATAINAHEYSNNMICWTYNCVMEEDSTAEKNGKWRRELSNVICYKVMIDFYGLSVYKKEIFVLTETFANSTERTDYSSDPARVHDDIGKIYLQSDTSKYYVLTGTSISSYPYTITYGWTLLPDTIDTHWDDSVDIEGWNSRKVIGGLSGYSQLWNNSEVTLTKRFSFDWVNHTASAQTMEQTISIDWGCQISIATDFSNNKNILSYEVTVNHGDETLEDNSITFENVDANGCVMRCYLINIPSGNRVSVSGNVYLNRKQT